MQVILHKHFLKRYKKLPKVIQKTFVARTHVLLTEPTNPLLHVHTLKGDLVPQKSMSVTGDYRALFVVDEETQIITFLRIGTHSELYG